MNANGINQRAVFIQCMLHVQYCSKYGWRMKSMYVCIYVLYL